MSDSESSPMKAANPYMIPLAIVLAGALIAGAVLYTDALQPTGVGSDAKGAGVAKVEIAPITEADHVLGSRDAEVFLVEFSDFQCGYCGRFHATVKELLKEYDGKVAWVYRHLPVGSGGPEARPAAIASECIAELGGNEAFWTFTEKVFANQRGLSTAWYLETATGLGIEGNAFTECFSSGKYDALIDAQSENATALGAQGTPHNMLVTKAGKTYMFRGALPPENIRPLIDRALREAK